MKNTRAPLLLALFLTALPVFYACEKAQEQILVESISVNKTTVELVEGESITLTAKIAPSNATNKNISWKSDNAGVASVDQNGDITAIKAGKATISVISEDGGKSATCAVTVKAEVTEGIGAVTGAATHISCRGAEIAGKASLPGTTSTDLSFGVLYSTSSGVLIGSATQIKAKVFDSDYNYTVNTEVLEPETTYYYRSYIIQEKEISYGELKSFKTLAVSSMIQTLDVTEINPKDAVLNASLDLTDCRYDALEYGFKVTSEGGGAYTVKSTNHSEKKFSFKYESLSRDTKYFVAAYVKLDGQTYKAEAKEFTTTSIQASVTAESSKVSYHSATISGKLTVESAGTFTKSAELYYSNTASTLDALKSSGKKMAPTLGADGSYSVNLSSLASDKQYNYVVVAKVDKVDLNTEVKSFKTLQIVATVTAKSSEVGCNTATISGKLTVDSEGTFTKSAELYYSNTASTLDALKSKGTKKTLSLNSDGTYSIIVDWLSINTKYYYCVVAKVDDVEFASSVKSLTTLDYQTPELVDLGLSVKWASFNLGASKPEEYGSYYQWAGLEDVTDTSINLDWDNCPYHTGSNEQTGWTKYVPSRYSSYWSGSGSPDNKTVLDPEDDVAYVTLGDKWRMPTAAEFQELRDNCTFEWKILNGVNGMSFTSKKNGNSIFLPAAGIRLNDLLGGFGMHCYYWDSSLEWGGNPTRAHGVSFDLDNVSWNTYIARHHGCSVRPIYGDRVSVIGVSLSKTSLNLEVGATHYLYKTVTPSNAAEQSVSWSSNDTSVATVDQSGKVTALKAGVATITVRTTDGGHTATCSVSVEINPGGSGDDFNWGN